MKTTKCLICGMMLPSPPPIIGQPGAALAMTMQALAAHLNTKHPDASRQMDLLGAQYIGLLFLRNFETTDPELNTEKDRVRWHVHQQTLAAHIPDTKLQAQTAQLATDLTSIVLDSSSLCSSTLSISGMVREEIAAKIQEKLLEVFTGLRDVLQEPNKYPAPSTVTLH